MRRAAGLQYDERGEGPAILSIHGAIISDSFAPLLREPALSTHRLIRCRRRGYGDSIPNSAPPTIEEPPATPARCSITSA